MTKKPPIIDATIEVRFETTVPTQVIVGLLFQNFKKELKRVEETDILQLPLEIRRSDPNLSQQPMYRLVGDNFVVSLGDGIIGIGVVVDKVNKFYPGWKVFGEFANNVLNFIDENKFSSKYNKVHVRYINFFEKEGLIDKTKLEVNVDGNPVYKNLTVFFEENVGSSLVRIQLAGKANVKNPYISLEGAIIDINASTEDTSITSIAKVRASVEQLHAVVKDKFYDLIKSEVLPEGIVKEG